ncbi:MAG: glycosyltransferase family 2 protein, partial [Desulfobacterales bacterium]|nr:glycosyltransferase family 2 protein [Desulfobacterales bacterium]
MTPPEITISIVAYNTPRQELLNCLESVCRTTLPFKCFIIDNVRSEQTRKQIKEAQKSLPHLASLEYIPNGNTGYGRAHNIAMRKVRDAGLGRYHLVLNPDIDFCAGMLEKLAAFMDQDQAVGLTMPKVLYPDGTPQKLCKLLPTPWHLLARRFFPWLVKKQDAVYQLESSDFDTPFECPSLSGCFMFLRTETLRQVGLFDERFFMYFEDVDLVRRIGQHYKTMYCPLAAVTHHYEKGSYSSMRLLLNHMVSGVKYFNKWGWFSDPQRQAVN